MRKQIAELIAKTYSEQEALDYENYQMKDKDIQILVDSGSEVLRNFPPEPNCCAPMSAIWTGMIRDHCPWMPIYTIAGSLDFQGKRIFGRSENSMYYQEGFSGITSHWNGHCWIVVGDYIGDISFLRTALQSSSSLKEMVVQKFGLNAYPIIECSGALEKLEFQYTPQYVPTTRQINGLIQSIQLIH